MLVRLNPCSSFHYLGFAFEGRLKKVRLRKNNGLVQFVLIIATYDFAVRVVARQIKTKGLETSLFPH